MRDPKFVKSVENVFRAAGIIGSLQFGLKMKEHEHDGVKIVAYRFPENKPLPDDPDGLRFNFEPCFAVVGDELCVASTLELGKKLVTELKSRQEGRRPRGGVARSGSRRRRGRRARGAADPLVTDAVLIARDRPRGCAEGGRGARRVRQDARHRRGSNST